MRRLLPTALLTAALLLLLPAVALAHATFDVTRMPAGGTQELTLRVPLERDATNQRVEVLVPGSWTVASCDGAEGWTCEQAETTDGDAVLTLERGEQGAGDAERFALTLTAPAEEGVYAFPTIQTYSDGEEVAWIDDAGTERPAPRIQVGDETAEVEYADEATPHTETADEEPTPGEDGTEDDAAAASPTPDADADAQDAGEDQDGTGDGDPAEDTDGTDTGDATQDDGATQDGGAEQDGGLDTGLVTVVVVVLLVLVVLGVALTRRS